MDGLAVRLPGDPLHLLHIDGLAAEDPHPVGLREVEVPLRLPEGAPPGVPGHHDPGAADVVVHVPDGRGDVHPLHEAVVTDGEDPGGPEVDVPPHGAEPEAPGIFRGALQHPGLRLHQGGGAVELVRVQGVHVQVGRRQGTAHRPLRDIPCEGVPGPCHPGQRRGQEGHHPLPEPGFGDGVQPGEEAGRHLVQEEVPEGEGLPVHGLQEGPGQGVQLRPAAPSPDLLQEEGGGVGPPGPGGRVPHQGPLLWKPQPLQGPGVQRRRMGIGPHLQRPHPVRQQGVG